MTDSGLAAGEGLPFDAAKNTKRLNNARRADMRGCWLKIDHVAGRTELGILCAHGPGGRRSLVCILGAGGRRSGQSR